MAYSARTTRNTVGALNHGDLGGTSESHLQDQFLIRVKWRAAQNPSLSFLVRPRRLQLFFNNSNVFNISNFFSTSNFSPRASQSLTYVHHLMDKPLTGE